MMCAKTSFNESVFPASDYKPEKNQQADKESGPRGHHIQLGTTVPSSDSVDSVSIGSSQSATSSENNIGLPEHRHFLKKNRQKYHDKLQQMVHLPSSYNLSKSPRKDADDVGLTSVLSSNEQDHGLGRIRGQ